MIVIRQKFISREDVRKQPDWIYLFGDNLLGTGMGGQAKEMRGEPNAIGIPTKKRPWYDNDSFFTDDEFLANTEAIDKAFQSIPPETEVVIIPEDGLGTGLAELYERAPKTAAYLDEWIERISNETE